jgi:ABC-type oligopeptide transport system ATPase subunit
MCPNLVVAKNVRKVYTPRRWFHGKTHTVVALDNVSIAVPRASTLAITGASGSGKSTLGRCIARLEDTTSGEIWFDGHNVSQLDGRRLLPFRQQIQFVFQDAATALNPRFSAVEIIEEPLLVVGQDTHCRRRRALELMDQVQLSPAWAHRRPFEFSGGQRQRLAIARALALDPKLLILDEALSGVDVSIQAQLVNLLLYLQTSRGLTYLFISHDTAVIPYMADLVAIMKEGRIVEICGSSELYRYGMSRCSQWTFEGAAREQPVASASLGA